MIKDDLLKKLRFNFVKAATSILKNYMKQNSDAKPTYFSNIYQYISF